MRLWRMSTSWIVSRSAWPMWSEPVTFGGGIAMTDGRRSSFGSRLARKMPCSDQKDTQRASTSAGSYAFGSSLIAGEKLAGQSPVRQDMGVFERTDQICPGDYRAMERTGEA